MKQRAAGIGSGIPTSVGVGRQIDPGGAERVRLRGKALGKGIIGFHQQSLRQAPAYLQLQSVIVAKTAVAFDKDPAQDVRIGHEEVRRQARVYSVFTESRVVNRPWLAFGDAGPLGPPAPTLEKPPPMFGLLMAKGPTKLVLVQLGEV